MSRSTASRDEGATFDELTAALKETLDRRGALRQIRASLRAEAFAALHNAAEQMEEENQESDASGTSRRPPLRPENAVINELIRDYLEFNGYLGAASVLEVEAGFAGGGNDDRELSREMIKLELGVIENDNGVKSKKAGTKKKIPLLYGIIEVLKRRKNG